MSCRVSHVNKKTGVTYVYESVSHWDKEKQQPRSKQVCIGKIDPITGELIPSRRLQTPIPAEAIQDGAPSIATVAVVGPSLILDALSKRLGLAKILKSVFPEFHAQILTMAYYLAAHGGPLSQCASWTKTHEHPSGTPLESQRISEILGKISTSGKLNLAMLFGQKGRIPVYFHRFPGNITDVQTIHKLLATFNRLEVKNLHYLLDRGFYSKKNID